MREIKFRGMDLNRWVYGDLVHNSNKEPTWIMPFQETTKFIPVARKTVGQYTGLKDREGTEIYEGDIIKARDVKVDGQDRFYICEVVWMPSGWHAMRYKDKMGKEHYLSINILETEIIGNIYENSEMLEVE